MLAALANYAALAFFVAPSWGKGRLFFRTDERMAADSAVLRAAMQTTTGVGVFIVLFQALAIVGFFAAVPVMALLMAGAAGAAVTWPDAWRSWRSWRGARALNASWTRLEWLLLLVLISATLPAVIAPLTPPSSFDELMYHLPYARQVAQSGSLGIHEWLRYPWFPYNYNLLYAAALMLGDDVLPHFLNAMAGGLSACILYGLGARHADRATGLIAAAVWLFIGDYSNALIDMGVALFILSGCAALSQWREATERNALRWLVLAAFLLGVAVGSKYQALTFMPLIAGYVLWHERRVRPLAIALAMFLLPCAYWYARNALLSGDPFNPLGGPLFGFTNWNAADYANQVLDVRSHAGAPHGLVWPAVLAPLSAFLRKSPALRAAGVLGLWSLAVWLASSAYPRYLMPAYPLLALMAALGWRMVMQKAVDWTTGQPRAAGVAAAPVLRRWIATGLTVSMVLSAIGVSGYRTTVRLRQAALSPPAREAFLRAKVPGYAVMNYLRTGAHGRVYQVALSEALYYGPNPIWGDTLGPWRYTDFLLQSAPVMARKLQAAGFGTIVIATPYLALLQDKPKYEAHFKLLFEQDGAKAYRIETIEP
ncbi:MAG: glycosyltransferase family 39 protein [Pseudoxanthomonas sp.]